MATPGKMKIQMKSGEFERDVAGFFGKMNPKYVIEFMSKKTEGEPCYDGGKKPDWFKEHDINVGRALDKLITFTIMHEEDIIGTTKIKAQTLADKKEESWFSIKHENEVVGKIKIQAEYKAPPPVKKPKPKAPEGVKAPVAPMQQPQVQGGMGPMGAGGSMPMMNNPMGGMMGAPMMPMQPMGGMGMQQPMMGMGMQQPMMGGMGMQQPMMGGMGMQQPMMGMGMQSSTTTTTTTTTGGGGGYQAPQQAPPPAKKVYSPSGHEMQKIHRMPYEDCDGINCDDCDTDIPISRGFYHCWTDEVDYCNRCENKHRKRRN